MCKSGISLLLKIYGVAYRVWYIHLPIETVITAKSVSVRNDSTPLSQVLNRIRATAACCFMRESLNILDIRRWFCFVASRIQSRCKIMSVEHKELYRSRDKCTGIISCFIHSTKSARIEHLESSVSNCLLYRSFVLRWSIRTNAHIEHGTHDIVHRK